MLFHNDLCGPLQVPNARIIAEPLPELMQRLRFSFGESRDARQRPHPALPIGQDRLNLSLLEHDFRDPDGVWVAGAAPRQGARVLREPQQQPLHDVSVSHTGAGRLTALPETGNAIPHYLTDGPDVSDVTHVTHVTHVIA